MNFVFVLFVVYQLKQWICDYPLQTEWMLGKFNKHGWFGPLASHAAVHALATFLIVKLSGMPFAFAMAMAHFDFVVHFTMDLIKTSPKLMGRWKLLSAPLITYFKSQLKVRLARQEAQEALRGNKLWHWAYGFDQMVHHLTHCAIIYMVALHR